MTAATTSQARRRPLGTCPFDELGEHDNALAALDAPYLLDPRAELGTRPESEVSYIFERSTPRGRVRSPLGQRPQQRFQGATLGSRGVSGHAVMFANCTDTARAYRYQRDWVVPPGRSASESIAARPQTPLRAAFKQHTALIRLPRRADSEGVVIVGFPARQPRHVLLRRRRQAELPTEAQQVNLRVPHRRKRRVHLRQTRLRVGDRQALSPNPVQRLHVRSPCLAESRERRLILTLQQIQALQ